MVGVFLVVLLVDTVFSPEGVDDQVVEDYLKQAREQVARNDDFILQILYESNFDTEKALRTLRRVALSPFGFPCRSS